MSGATWQYSCLNYQSGSTYYNRSYFYYIPSSIKTVTITNQDEAKTAAFNQCSNITKISYTEDLTSLGQAVCQNCSALTSFNSEESKTIDLSGNFSSIGPSAFYNCGKIEQIVFAENVEAIGSQAFDSCNSVLELNLTNKIVSIGSYAFKNLSKVTSVTVYNSTESIGRGAFYGCNGLQSVSLPFTGNSNDATAYKATLGYIFNYTTTNASGSSSYGSSNASSDEFYNSQYSSANGAIWQYSCLNYQSGTTYYNTSYFYYIPSSLKVVNITNQSDVKDAAFNGCMYIESINYTKELTKLGTAVFQNCKALKTFNSQTEGTMNLSGTYTTLSSYAARDCAKIDALVIPSTVTKIGAYAFENLIKISEVTVPNSVEEIGVGAFKGCTGLQSMSLPFTGKSADAEAYEAVFGYIFGYSTTNASGISSYGSSNASSDEFYNGSYSSVSGATWQYSCLNYQSGSTYYNRSYFYYIPSSIKTVTITNQDEAKTAAFNGCKYLEKIIFIKGCSIGDYAFQNCTATIHDPTK